MYNRRKAEVLELAAEEEITPRDVADRLGVEIHAARNLVRRFRRQGLLKKVGVDSLGAKVYVITEWGEERLEWLREELEGREKENLLESISDELRVEHESLAEGARTLLDEYLSLSAFFEELVEEVREVEERGDVDWYFDERFGDEWPEDEEEMLRTIVKRGALYTVGEGRCEREVSEIVDEMAEELDLEFSTDESDARALLAQYSGYLLEEYAAARAELEEREGTE